MIPPAMVFKHANMTQTCGLFSPETEYPEYFTARKINIVFNQRLLFPRQKQYICKYRII
jgi:hypothetical protein